MSVHNLEPYHLVDIVQYFDHCGLMPNSEAERDLLINQLASTVIPQLQRNIENVDIHPLSERKITFYKIAIKSLSSILDNIRNPDDVDDIETLEMEQGAEKTCNYFNAFLQQCELRESITYDDLGNTLKHLEYRKNEFAKQFGEKDARYLELERIGKEISTYMDRLASHTSAEIQSIIKLFRSALATFDPGLGSWDKPLFDDEWLDGTIKAIDTQIEYFKDFKKSFSLNPGLISEIDSSIAKLINIRSTLESARNIIDPFITEDSKRLEKKLTDINTVLERCRPYLYITKSEELSYEKLRYAIEDVVEQIHSLEQEKTSLSFPERIREINNAVNELRLIEANLRPTFENVFDINFPSIIESFNETLRALKADQSEYKTLEDAIKDIEKQIDRFSVFKKVSSHCPTYAAEVENALEALRSIQSKLLKMENGKQKKRFSRIRSFFSRLFS